MPMNRRGRDGFPSALLSLPSLWQRPGSGGSTFSLRYAEEGRAPACHSVMLTPLDRQAKAKIAKHRQRQSSASSEA
jgi:hypothetical protein